MPVNFCRKWCKAVLAGKGEEGQLLPVSAQFPPTCLGVISEDYGKALLNFIEAGGEGLQHKASKKVGEFPFHPGGCL